MSQTPTVLDMSPQDATRMSLRGRLLIKLERFFPPLDTAPALIGDESAFEFAKAEGSYAAYVREIGGLEGKTVLDFGCGWGGESAWLAEQAAHVVGCDINADALADAEHFKQSRGLTNLDFARVGDQSLPFEDNQFDAIFSTNVFEHVMYPEQILAEIYRVLKPGGSFLSSFGPLFYSPLGYHLCWATQVPYAHLLFGFGPVIEVRNTKRAPWHPTSWKQTGLNGLTFNRFRRAVRQSNLEPKRLNRLAVRNLDLLAKTPLLGNLLTFGIDCHLVKPLR